MTDQSGDLKGLFYEALRKWLTKQTGTEVLEITSMESDSYESGGCPSCAYIEHEVNFSYKAGGDMDRYGGLSYTYSGRFTDMLNELLEEDV